MEKMTTKNTIKEIAAFLGKASANKSVKANKNLFDRMKYTSSAIKKGQKIAKKDLLELADECFKVMAAAESKPETKPEQKPKKESSLKKKSSKEEVKKEEPKAEEKKPAKDSKKSAEKAKEEKKPEPKSKGFSFPEEFEDEDGIKYTLDESLNSHEAIKKAIEDEEDIVIATHWTEAMLKTGLYGNGQITKKSDMPKSFDKDLDLLQIVYVAENLSNVITVSMYTECEYWFAGSDFKKMVSNNLAFRVYRTEE